LLFYEYFDGDNGTRIGPSQQTGWTGDYCAADGTLGKFDAQSLVREGREGVFGAMPERV
jgi:hypothetical protein